MPRSLTTTMTTYLPLLVLLSLILIGVSQQTYPYVSFMGQTLVNHSYVDITTVGDNSNNNIQCVTDLHTCCSENQGIHRGDWYFPDGSVLNFSGNIREDRQPQRVILDINERYTPQQSGMYRCGIPSNMVHHMTQKKLRVSVYIGLYTASEGTITILEISFKPDQLVLTCISTGGPATTVTWIRDSTILTEGTETVLNDPVTAKYTHTLAMVTAGKYICNVSNDKPSFGTASILIPGPNSGASPLRNVKAVQSNATSIKVTWTPSYPLREITGYEISYISESTNSSIYVSGILTDSYMLTDLTNGDTVSVSVMGTNPNSPPSAPRPVQAEAIGLVPVSTPTLLSPTLATSTNITITGSYPSGSVVTGYVVEWTRDTSVGCSDRNQSTIIETGDFTNYTIIELVPDNRYTVTVRLRNNAGNGPVSNDVNVTTLTSSPSAAPTSLRVGAVTSNSVTVHWEEVPCLHRNGEITSYDVIARNSEGSVEGNVTVGGDVLQATVTGLNPSTQYSLEVKATNIAGTGPLVGTSIETTGDNNILVVVVGVAGVVAVLAVLAIAFVIVLFRCYKRKKLMFSTRDSKAVSSNTYETQPKMSENEAYGVHRRCTELSAGLPPPPISSSVINSSYH